MQTDGKVVCGDIYRTEQNLAAANKLHEKNKVLRKGMRKLPAFLENYDEHPTGQRTNGHRKVILP